MSSNRYSIKDLTNKFDQLENENKKAILQHLSIQLIDFSVQT